MTADRAPGAWSPRAVEFHGEFNVPGSIERVFELFSPLGERKWVPGWDPALLHPPGVSWEQGLVFRTREEQGDALWLVTRLDRTGHAVEYHRLEPGRYVARVRVHCTPCDDQETSVHVAYMFVGLSEAGSTEIAAMTQRAYDEKLARWTLWIIAHFRGGSPGV